MPDRADEPLEAAIHLCRAIDPWHPIWHATQGVEGPLPALYVAAEEADRLGYVGGDPEWWHSDVREAKALALHQAELLLTPSIDEARRAILSHPELT